MTLDPTGTRMVRSYQGFLYLDDVETGQEVSLALDCTDNTADGTTTGISFKVPISNI